MVHCRPQGQILRQKRTYQDWGHFLGTTRGSLNVLYEHHKDLEEESQGPQHAVRKNNT